MSSRGRAYAAILRRVTASHPNSEVKLRQAWVVLWWGTTWEGPVLCVLLFRDVALFVSSVFCFSRRCRSQRGVPSRLRTVTREPCVARGRKTEKSTWAAQSRMSHGRVWHAVEKKTKEATLGSGRGSTIVGDHMGRPAHGKARCCVFCFCMRQRR